MIDDAWLPALLALDALVVAVAALDALLGLPRARNFRVEQAAAGTWSLGRVEQVVFTVDHLARLGRSIAAVPDVPREFSVEESLRHLVLPGRNRAELVFKISAQARGVFALGGLHLAATSRLGLWRRSFLLGGSRTVHVYPNLKQLGEYALLARTNRLSLIGVRSSRRLGGDTEFERLRDYHSDDPIQRVDWKSTARRDALTVRDYQTSQSQNLVLMVDAGRMMVSRSVGKDGRSGSLLDHAIDAALMLAFVALQHGDRVGLIAYADGIKRYVPSRGGARQLNLLIHALHDLQPTLAESRHDEAFVHLERRERKRSLVVALTHVLDEVNAGQLQRHAANLVGRHLPLVVLLQDRDLHDHLRAAPVGIDGFWNQGAAALIANWRTEVVERLTTSGALAIDTASDQITAALISRYLQVKAKHLL